MNLKMTNGILFIIGAIAPIAIYMGLGPDGADVIDNAAAEKIVFWIMLSLPVAFMMTADTMSGGSGHSYAKAGLLIMIISYAAGSVGDGIYVQNSEMGEALTSTFWPAMMMGFGITGIGYFVQKTFPTWLSGLMILIGLFGFVVIGIIGIDNEALEIPLWLGFTITNLSLGILTIRNNKNTK